MRRDDWVGMSSLVLVGAALACGGRAESSADGAAEPGLRDPSGRPGNALPAASGGSAPSAAAPGSLLPARMPTTPGESPPDPPTLDPPTPSVPMVEPPAVEPPRQEPPTKGPILPRCDPPETVIELVDQADVDEIAGCETLRGIRVYGALDLRPLSSLRRVEQWGVLLEGVSSLEGLEGLEETGTLQFWNTTVPSLHQLSSLRRVGFLELAATEFVDLSGLELVTSIDSLVISGNGRLESLAGLAVTGDMARIDVLSNPVLRDIDSLTGVTSVQQLAISDNLVFDRALVFQALTSLGAVLISNNPSLRSGPEFQLITSVGAVHVYDNAALESVTGFSNVRTASSLQFARNPSLFNLDLNQLLEVSSQLEVFDNPLLDAAAREHLAGVPSSMNRVAPDQTTTVQEPCPWTADEICDELHGFCAQGSDPACALP